MLYRGFYSYIFKSMKALFKLIFYIVLLISLLFVAAFLIMAYLDKKINEPVNFSGQARIFEVKQGQGAKEIAQNLQNEGIVSDKEYFLIYLWEIGRGNKLKVGKYSIGPSMSVRDIAGTMIAGDVLKNEVRITIPEGFNLSEIEDKLVENKIISKDSLKNYNYLASDIWEKYSFLNRDCKGTPCTLEGYLFPDTYIFSTDKLPADIDEVVVKFLDNFDKKTKDLRDKAGSKNINFRDIMTMASIIEKEVQTPSDMKTVSGVLWKRISIGMPLQVDAPIVYITGKKTGEITFADLKIESPFNTYLHKGLPPAPISNPGLNAIDAALNPIQNDYLYYLSKPTGETVFSKTLEEHNKAKNLYLR